MPYIVDQTAGKLGRGEDLKSVIPWLVLRNPYFTFLHAVTSCPGRPCARLFVAGGAHTRLLRAQNSFGCLDTLFEIATQALCVEA
ncbi:hypothetical protein L3X38_020387 [Prunus dulcis]|uniref:Uncharacterized protein n=1 Tax=Prunus dulcis TaxID=3755 RepID=A0AAD4WDP9_PRUDU|nr:hypothetical protein L3X38_020387 [Prunus dulcis]